MLQQSFTVLPTIACPWLVIGALSVIQTYSSNITPHCLHIQPGIAEILRLVDLAILGLLESAQDIYFIYFLFFSRKLLCPTETNGVYNDSSKYRHFNQYCQP